jgi:hypothetical protein
MDGGEGCGVEMERHSHGDYVDYADYVELQDKRAGLRDALEWYGNEKNYNPRGGITRRSEAKVICDRGGRARAALAKSAKPGGQKPGGNTPDGDSSGTCGGGKASEETDDD